MAQNRISSAAKRMGMRVPDADTLQSLRFTPVTILATVPGAGIAAGATVEALQDGDAPEVFFHTATNRLQRRPAFINAVRVILPSTATDAEVDAWKRGASLVITSAGQTHVIPFTVMATRNELGSPESAGPVNFYSLPYAVYWDGQRADTINVQAAEALTLNGAVGGIVELDMHGLFSRQGDADAMSISAGFPDACAPVKGSVAAHTACRCGK